MLGVQRRKALSPTEILRWTRSSQRTGGVLYAEGSIPHCRNRGCRERLCKSGSKSSHPGGCKIGSIFPPLRVSWFRGVKYECLPRSSVFPAIPVP